MVRTPRPIRQCRGLPFKPGPQWAGDGRSSCSSRRTPLCMRQRIDGNLGLGAADAEGELGELGANLVSPRVLQLAALAFTQLPTPSCLATAVVVRDCLCRRERGRSGCRRGGSRKCRCCRYCVFLTPVPVLVLATTFVAAFCRSSWGVKFTGGGFRTNISREHGKGGQRAGQDAEIGEWAERAGRQLHNTVQAQSRGLRRCKL